MASATLIKMRNWALLLLIVSACLAFGCQSLVRKALFYPTHHTRDHGLTRWMQDAALIGYSRPVNDPHNIWLLLHGNGGQAADREYALHAFAATDAVFILEYPGYGERSGKPTRAGIDAAALGAYQLLRSQFPGKPVCVAAESIGSGPASTLAALPEPPDKFVLVVPFDTLKSVARDHVRWLPVGMLLAGSWDNVQSLANYRGPVEIFGAQRDEVIAIEHARKLAASIPQAKFHLIPGGHNEWSRQSEVEFRNP